MATKDLTYPEYQELSQDVLIGLGFYVGTDDGDLFSRTLPSGDQWLCVDGKQWLVGDPEILGQVLIPNPPKTVGELRSLCSFFNIPLGPR